MKPLWPRFPRRTHRRVSSWAIAALWLAGLACGFRGLIAYELKPGVAAPAAVAPVRWVADASLSFDPQCANLIMFAHPQCPCSRASIAELATIMTKAQGKLQATVCFYDPEGEPTEWTQSGLWSSASAIPGVRVVSDHDGAIAERFGSATSGQVFLFDRHGVRVFAGGITGARGHEGDNRGRNYVIALARGELCTPTDTPVYGCSLNDVVEPESPHRS